MSERDDLAAQRRQQLLAQASAQRFELERQREQVRQSLTTVDLGLRIVDKLYRHPEWIIAAAVGLALVRPRRLSSVMRLGTAGLRSWHEMRPVLQQLMERRRGLR